MTWGQEKSIGTVSLMVMGLRSCAACIYLWGRRVLWSCCWCRRLLIRWRPVVDLRWTSTLLCRCWWAIAVVGRRSGNRRSSSTSSRDLKTEYTNASTDQSLASLDLYCALNKCNRCKYFQDITHAHARTQKHKYKQANTVCAWFYFHFNLNIASTYIASILHNFIHYRKTGKT